MPPERCSIQLFSVHPRKLGLCRDSQHWGPFPKRHQMWQVCLCVLSTHKQNRSSAGSCCNIQWIIPTCLFLLLWNLPEAQPALLDLPCAIALLHIPLATAWRPCVPLVRRSPMGSEGSSTSPHCMRRAMPLPVVRVSGQGCPGALHTVTWGISADMGQMWYLGLPPRDPSCTCTPCCACTLFQNVHRGISFKQDYGGRLSLGYTGGKSALTRHTWK